MKVKLLAYTPEPEKTVACAAKLCYAAADIDTVYEGLTEEKTASFLEMLNSIGHESPIEHASFTFGIEGVSRSLLAQDYPAPHRLLQRAEPALCEGRGLPVRAPSGDRGSARGQGGVPAGHGGGPETLRAVDRPAEREAPGGVFGPPERQRRPLPARRRKRPLRTPALCCPTPVPPR